MLKIGFITCSDLSRYFVSQKNPLLTHDDQLACDYLETRGCVVESVVWGTNIKELSQQNFDLLIVRSPWDYFDSDENLHRFLDWLAALKQNNVRLLNDFDILKWSLDKHYLRELSQAGISIVPTEFLEAHESLEKIQLAFARLGRMVVKPCVAAAAKDAFLIRDTQELQGFLATFAKLRAERAFMIQPFIEDISSQGEWSLVFLNNQYSHAVLKKPKTGGWLVQDELGGSVHSLEPPADVRNLATNAYEKLTRLLRKRFGADAYLLYARLDVLPGLRLGELELAEPELFFLDRESNQPNIGALQKFYEGIISSLRA